MAGAGIAMKGISKILKKGLKASSRGVKTASLTPRRLRGETLATKPTDKYTKVLKRSEAELEKTKKPGYKTGIAEGVTTGVLATLAALKIKEGKEAKAKEKEKLEKATKHHYEKSKKKSKKRGE